MKAVLYFSFSAALMLAGFQNCAPVGVEDLNSTSQKALGDLNAPVDDVPPPVDGGDPIVIGDPTLPPVADNPPMPSPMQPPADDGDDEPAPPSLPPMADTPGKKDDEPKKDHPKSDDPAMPPVADQPDQPDDDDEPKKDHPKSDDPVKLPVADNPGKNEDKDKDEDDGPVACAGDDCIPDEPSEGDATALCLKKAKSKRAALAGPEIVKIRGNVLVSSDNLTRVEDTRGHMVIQGKTSAALAKLIKNTRGAMIICGMTVEDMNDVRGHVVLVNSTVKNLSNFRGNIRLLNSEIENSSDIRGNIKPLKK